MNKKEAKKLIERHPDVAANIVVAADKFLTAFQKRAFVLTRKLEIEAAIGKGGVTAINALIEALESVPVDDSQPKKERPVATGPVATPTQSQTAPQGTAQGGTTPSQSAVPQPTA